VFSGEIITHPEKNFFLNIWVYKAYNNGEISQLLLVFFQIPTKLSLDILKNASF